MFHTLGSALEGVSKTIRQHSRRLGSDELSASQKIQLRTALKALQIFYELHALPDDTQLAIVWKLRERGEGDFYTDLSDCLLFPNTPDLFALLSTEKSSQRIKHYIDMARSLQAKIFISKPVMDLFHRLEIRPADLEKEPILRAYFDIDGQEYSYSGALALLQSIDVRTAGLFSRQEQP